MLGVAQGPAAWAHLEGTDEPLQAPGVFGGDDIGGFKERHQPERGVAHISDRCGSQDNAAVSRDERPGARIWGGEVFRKERGVVVGMFRLVRRFCHWFSLAVPELSEPLGTMIP